MDDVDWSRAFQYVGIAIGILVLGATLIGGAMIAGRRRKPSSVALDAESEHVDVALGTIGAVSVPDGWCVVCGMARGTECWPGYQTEGIDPLGKRALHQSAPMYVVADVGRSSLCPTHKRVAERVLGAKLAEVRSRTAAFNSQNEAELAACEMSLLTAMQLEQRRAVEAMRAAAASVTEKQPAQLPPSYATVTLLPRKEEDDADRK